MERLKKLIEHQYCPEAQFLSKCTWLLPNTVVMTEGVL